MKTTAAIAVAAPSFTADVMVLMKFRLNALVVATTAGGFFMGASNPLDVRAMVITCVGTALVAGGASAVNQIQERDTDRLMERTRHRPLAEGRMSPAQAGMVAAVTSGIGLLMLWFGVGRLPALVALATLASYVACYTPLKRITSLATIVGAIPGALPPLIGWTASRGSLDVVAWSLFLIMFFWQLPHFLAISWMYRDDYARASLPMLAVIDAGGRVTGFQALLWAATLVPVTLLPTVLHLSSGTYAVGAFALGLALLAIAAAFARRRTHANARMLFLASIAYLPLLWILMAIGRP
jgi:protoheme IX farnesyltransferase